MILKDNVNKFIFKGRIDDYALDVKAREKKENSSKTRNGGGSDQEMHDEGNTNCEEKEKKEINISYSEFKKRNVKDS